jgi:hypothetical protein
MSPLSLMVHKIPKCTIIRDRGAFIAKTCENRSVLHLGCAGWPLTTESALDGSLLHLRLSRVSTRAFGIDICERGLLLLRSVGFKDLIHWDVEKLDQLRIEDQVEVIVAGEILEHLSNPGLCLQGIAQFMSYPKCKLVVTVPNAFSLRHLVSVLFFRTELVMPDHTAYYSFSTLVELLARYNLQVREMYVYAEVDRRSSFFRRLAKRLFNATVLRVFPQVAQGMIAVAEIGNKVGPQTDSY